MAPILPKAQQLYKPFVGENNNRKKRGKLVLISINRFDIVHAIATVHFSAVIKL